MEQLVGSSPDPAVVEFYATRCGDCRRIAPLLDDLEAEFASRVRLVKVNADENPTLVARFGVSSTPTLFAIVDNSQVATAVGAQPVPILRALFDSAAGAGCGCGPSCESGTSTQRVADANSGWVPAEACTLPTADQPLRLSRVR
ncbi:hypothetical protein GCM10022267_34910 [Lentzea roselyniae]|uniref:Thioredoxin domain-containing protein n=1 Tax=Lentzea roselyniae TaxID=531940 RepID=A0ABP7B220_9PSEU